MALRVSHTPRSRPRRSRYDCIVIGGGHNGLIAAAYLAQAGKSVCVVERRAVLGGCATSEALWPGYRVSTAAYVISLLLPQVIRDLRLKEHGLTVLPRNPSSFTPLADGRHLLMGSDSAANRRAIAGFSRRDAEAFPRYDALLDRVARALEPVVAAAAPNPFPLPRARGPAGAWERLRGAAGLWRLYRRLGRLGSDLPAALELLTGAARPILERWFETEALRATLATDAIIGAFASPAAPGTAYVLLHHAMGRAGGARGVWGYVQGGMGGLADALEAACAAAGVDVRREAEVRRIATAGGAARGVVLADGTAVEAPVVASSVDAHLTFRKFLAPDDLPADFLAAVARIDYSSASAKINLALAEPPNFTCLPSRGVAPQHHGTIHIGETLDYVERAYADARAGRPSTDPVLEVTLPTAVDATIAPPGKHILSIFAQYAPYELADGAHWDDVKDAFADRCIARLAQYAPNVPDAVEHRQVLSPLDLERTFGLTGGNIMQGAMNLNQLFFMRPAPGWADHRTPVRGLYLCGAASHPGGGVMGACGRNAARAILQDGGR